MSAYVLLEDGERFDGEAVGADGPVTGEVVFTTGMSGYQESMTDPSFARQLITFTVPHVGNYGVRAAAMESGRIHAAGAIMREAVDTADAPGAEQGWLSWLREHGIPGISGVDTRALVRHIRDEGAMRGGIFPAAMAPDEAMDRVRAEPSMVGRDLAREVTVAAPETHGDGDGPRIVALDTGIKRSIIRNFTSRGAVLELYPCTAGADELLAATPTASSSCPARATRRRSATSSTRSARCWPPSRCSASASATSCSRARPAWTRSSSRSATAAPTTRSRTCAPAGSRSPRRTTASPSAASPASGSSPSSGPPSSRT